METILLKIIEQLNSSVALLILIFVAFIWLVYKAGVLSESFTQFKSQTKGLSSDIKKINYSLNKIQATTDLLYQAHLRTVSSQSPLDLTDKGTEVALKIGAEEKVNSHWNEIVEEFRLRGNPDNPYDIQKLALELAQSCFERIFTEEERAIIKTYAFNSGMNMLEIYPVIGIKIRDRILKEKKISIGKLADGRQT